MKDRDDIEKRYEQYRCHELPGQPMGAHMGTVYLMNDLHTALVETEAERNRLRDLLRVAANKIRRGRISADYAAKIDAALQGIGDE